MKYKGYEQANEIFSCKVSVELLTVSIFQIMKNHCGMFDHMTTIFRKWRPDFSGKEGSRMKMKSYQSKNISDVTVDLAALHCG